MKMFGSSVDSSQLAMTWRGLALLSVPFIIWLFSVFGVVLTENDVIYLIDELTKIIGACLVAFGLGRKLWVFIKLKK